MTTPRIAAIHDLSGFGRCSLTVALPILSVMGAQCCPVPTASLSTHTGAGFEGFSFLDMTDEIPKFTAHWASLGLAFDAIYSGFLGSEAQIALVRDFIATFQTPKTQIIIDPVMGDHGEIYKTYTPKMCQGMVELAAQAHVITPNMTEAALLLGRPYHEMPTRLPGIEQVVSELSLRGTRSVVLTGVSVYEDTTGAVCYDCVTGHAHVVQTDCVPRTFHGTGDIFASVLTGALVRGHSVHQATKQAVAFVHACVQRSAAQNLTEQAGVDFEPLLGQLTKRNR